MPLDGHTYLVKQGWTGKGNGLRHGSISRPLAVPQKRNLAGLGKDRDEAFPFWDHLFSAAAKSLEIKIKTDDDSSDTDDEKTNGDSPTVLELKRTCTGLISNKRPIHGTNASSGTSTPGSDSSAPGFKLSLLAEAKRQAARQGLYARFFRGRVLEPETSEVTALDDNVASSSATIVSDYSQSATAEPEERIGKKRKRKDKEGKVVKKKEKEHKKKGEEKVKGRYESEEHRSKSILMEISAETNPTTSRIGENDGNGADDNPDRSGTESLPKNVNGSKSNRRKARSEEEKDAKKLRKKLREEKRKRKEEKRRLKKSSTETS